MLSKGTYPTVGPPEPEDKDHGRGVDTEEVESHRRPEETLIDCREGTPVPGLCPGSRIPVRTLKRMGNTKEGPYDTTKKELEVRKSLWLSEKNNISTV